MTHAALQDLRLRLERCELAAMVDLATGICLLSATTVPVGQEKLNALCAQAAMLLAADANLGETFCVLAHPSDLRVFVRAASGQSEALCLVFAPDAFVDTVEAQAKAFLSRTVGKDAHV